MLRRRIWHSGYRVLSRRISQSTFFCHISRMSAILLYSMPRLGYDDVTERMCVSFINNRGDTWWEMLLIILKRRCFWCGSWSVRRQRKYGLNFNGRQKRLFEISSHRFMVITGSILRKNVRSGRWLIRNILIGDMVCRGCEYRILFIFPIEEKHCFK